MTKTKHEQTRSIRFEPKVWEAIDRDAARCNRSAVKHMEAIFTLLYDLGDPEMDLDRIAALKNALDMASVRDAKHIVVKSSETDDEFRKKRRTK